MNKMHQYKYCWRAATVGCVMKLPCSLFLDFPYLFWWDNQCHRPFQSFFFLPCRRSEGPLSTLLKKEIISVYLGATVVRLTVEDRQKWLVIVERLSVYVPYRESCINLVSTVAPRSRHTTSVSPEMGAILSQPSETISLWTSNGWGGAVVRDNRRLNKNIVGQ